MKRIFSTLLLLTILLCGCSSSIETTESKDYIKIDVPYDQTEDFLKEINKNVVCIDSKALLGGIRMYFDSQYNMQIQLTYFETENLKKSTSIEVLYDVTSGGIVSVNTLRGPSKGILYYDHELSVEQWTVNFRQGTEYLRALMQESNIPKFDRAICVCTENQWNYTVFVNPEDTYDKTVKFCVDTN